MNTDFSDFKVTHENCENEPIHRPVHIQDQGYLLAFDDKKPEQLIAISANTQELIGKTEQELWAAPASDWLPDTLYASYTSAQATGQSARGIYSTVTLQDQPYSVIIHHHSGYWYVELELATTPDFDILQEVLKVTHGIKACNNLPELLKITPKLLKQLIGYDRIMIYQFDQYGHGQVVGEAKEDHLEPFLNMYYPASDIPQIARDLFLKNKSRILINTYANNHPIIFHPKTDSRPVLDMTYSQHRATSPIHIEYLMNMGVNATLTIALIHEGKLWGLFACHHYSERLISYELRRALEIIADTFSFSRFNLLQNEHQMLSRSMRDRETLFLNKINLNENIGAQLTANQEVLMDLCEADGAAAVAHEKSTYTIGITPSDHELILLRNWMIENNHIEIFSTADFGHDVPLSKSFATQLGGMMAICTSIIDRSYLFWFRQTERQQTTWGGDPNTPYNVETYNEGKEIRLSPRKSFEKWELVINGEATPWQPYELEMAVRIREAILKKEFQRAAEKVEQLREEYMELTYAASHDLLQPLRTLSNYMELIKEEIAPLENEDLTHFIKRSTFAVQRMSELVQDLLIYSRVGKTNEKKSVNIHVVISEIIDDLDAMIKMSDATIHVGAMPVIKGDRLEIRQIFLNLITNALKYHRKGVRPEVEITVSKDGNYWLFTVKDNGIGIEAKYFDQIFEMFQRLHSKEEYTGTGIGLALVKKIVQLYDGTIWVESKINSGSTFNFRIHEMNIDAAEK